MHSVIQKIINLKSQLKLEQIYNAVILIIVLTILLLAVFTMNRAVNSSQFSNTVMLSKQSVYPRTQDMAEQLLQQETISYAQYLRLMQAHHVESHLAKQFPAMAAEEQ